MHPHDKGVVHILGEICPRSDPDVREIFLSQNSQRRDFAKFSCRENLLLYSISAMDASVTCAHHCPKCEQVGCEQKWKSAAETRLVARGARKNEPLCCQDNAQQYEKATLFMLNHTKTKVIRQGITLAYKTKTAWHWVNSSKCASWCCRKSPLCPLHKYDTKINMRLLPTRGWRFKCKYVNSISFGIQETLLLSSSLEYKGILEMLGCFGILTFMTLSRIVAFVFPLGLSTWG